MAEMLQDSKWTPAHALMLAGFVCLLTALLTLTRSVPIATGTRKWIRIAVLCTGLQVLEMALHTAAAVDRDALLAGRPTPILSTHLAISVIAYPLFSLAMIGLIWSGTQERRLGSRWIGWVGILGALAHGLAAPLAVLFQVSWAPFLFPGLLLFALWLLLAAFWPAGSMATPSPEIGHTQPNPHL
jgi:hypothetical protein